MLDDERPVFDGTATLKLVREPDGTATLTVQVTRPERRVLRDAIRMLLRDVHGADDRELARLARRMQ